MTWKFFTKTETNSVLAGLLLGSKKDRPYDGNETYGDDVAKLQVPALQTKIPGNSTFIAAIDMKWEDAIDVLRNSFPKQVTDECCSVEGKQSTLAVNFSNQKTQDVFGFKFTPLGMVVEAVAGQYLELQANGNNSKKTSRNVRN
jgi:hypothetical protein